MKIDFSHILTAGCTIMRTLLYITGSDEAICRKFRTGLWLVMCPSELSAIKDCDSILQRDHEMLQMKRSLASQAHIASVDNIGPAWVSLSPHHDLFDHLHCTQI